MSQIKYKKSEYKEKEGIWIKGARLHNLKNIEIQIPKYALTSVTGLSGSGKSSLIMDTLYAEGQRRYVESMSSYARQFLARLKKPEVDFIKGLCPAIAIEQKVVTGNQRSTVGSMTEIYDLLRMLYARIGITISPISGKTVVKHQVSDVVQYVQTLKEGSKIVIASPLDLHYLERSLDQQLQLIQERGFDRILVDGTLTYISDYLANTSKAKRSKTIDQYPNIWVLIDRIVYQDSKDINQRVADSVQLAFQSSNGGCYIFDMDTEKSQYYSNRFEMDGIQFPELTPQLFNYNNPYGACPQCEGYGKSVGIDPSRVIPNENLSIYEGAIAPWTSGQGQRWADELIQAATSSKIPIHKPYRELSKKQKELIWSGNKRFGGISTYFELLQAESYKIQNRVLISRYRGRTTCHVCEGSRLRKEANYVQVGGKSIGALIFLPIEDLLAFFQQLKLDKHDAQIAKRLLFEIDNRLRIMNQIGLGYLQLDRVSNTLSGGETQRINLTRMLGSNLTDSIYILDEPSIGLHPRDTEALIRTLHQLRDLGNTVIVVEHEAQIIEASDYILDIGPRAGIHGGEVMYIGNKKGINKAKNSLTSEYLTGKKKIQREHIRTKFSNYLNLTGVYHNNLLDANLHVPLQAITVVSGVSGSGKSSLIMDVLYPALKQKLGLSSSKRPGSFESLAGDVKLLSDVEAIGQHPIGRSSRSNPATYIKVFDQIRQLYLSQQLSKIRNYKLKHFSFNVDGGRCEQCKGEGFVTVEMQFLADVNLVCDSCHGKRFKDEILEVQFREKNIYDILEMSVLEALDFFQDHKQISSLLQPLVDVGLDYVKLGQPSSTLSGGEAQRLKLASFLTKEKHNEHIFFIFDEPTTGLHFHDVNKLLVAFDMLVERGNTVLIIEHDLDVIRNADYVVDLGPLGGHKGGQIVFQGTVEKLKKNKNSITAKYL